MCLSFPVSTSTASSSARGQELKRWLCLRTAPLQSDLREFISLPSTADSLSLFPVASYIPIWEWDRLVCLLSKSCCTRAMQLSESLLAVEHFSHQRVKARRKQRASSATASETRSLSTVLSLIKLSVIAGTDPKARQLLVPRLSCCSSWVCSYPAVLRLLHQESPFSHLDSAAAAFPPTFRMRRGAVLLL